MSVRKTRTDVHYTNTGLEWGGGTCPTVQYASWENTSRCIMRCQDFRSGIMSPVHMGAGGGNMCNTVKTSELTLKHLRAY